MKTTRCFKCRKIVSLRAQRCPHCGLNLPADHEGHKKKAEKILKSKRDWARRKAEAEKKLKEYFADYDHRPAWQYINDSRRCVDCGAVLHHRVLGNHSGKELRGYGPSFYDPKMGSCKNCGCPAPLGVCETKGCKLNAKHLVRYHGQWVLACTYHGPTRCLRCREPLMDEDERRIDYPDNRSSYNPFPSPISYGSGPIIRDLHKDKIFCDGLAKATLRHYKEALRRAGYNVPALYPPEKPRNLLF